MNEFETLKDYEEYLAGLSRDHLIDIANNIDRNLHPERYELVKEYISKAPAPESAKQSREKGRGGAGRVSLIGYLYIGLLVWNLFLIACAVIAMDSPFDDLQTQYSILLVFVFSLLAYGVFKLKTWAHKFALVWGYLCIFSNFVFFFRSPETSFISNFFILLITALYAYQIYLFSKADVRKLFRSNETVLISR